MAYGKRNIPHILRLARIAVLGLWPFVSGSGQELKPQGRFLSDSLSVGLPVRYSLSLRHPADLQVVFPDSGYRFAPFEWVGKRYFPTRTDSRGSLDSVVYTLTTFDINPVQRLQLPVFIVSQKDCTAIYAETDSVFVRQMITQPPKFLPPRANLQYVTVRPTFDYLFWAAVALIGGLLLLLIYAAFGKGIKRQFTRYRLWRAHRNFVGAYEKLRRRVRQQKEPTAVENTVILWKRYMEGLHEKPYSSYTTKEIVEIIPDPQLADSLHIADRAIYGNLIPEEIYGALRTLQSIAGIFYKRKQAEVSRPV